MKKAFQSGLALILCLVMALSLIPTSAAEDIEIIDIEEEDDVFDVPEDEDYITVVEPEDVTDPDAEIQSTIIASGACGDNLTWTLDDEGTLTISGTGEMDNASWHFYRPRIQSVIICNGTQNILHEAFASCGYLTNVSIPSSVTSIDFQAFYGCSALREIVIPNGITSIGDGCFGNCYELESVTIPSSMTVLESNVFANCNKLGEIHFDGSAPQIGDNCFLGVTATVYYPENESSWTEDIRQNYGGTLTWMAYTNPAFVASGECGDDLTWTLDEEGTLTISGTGPMWDWNVEPEVGIFNYCPWRQYYNILKSVIIQHGVTSIGNFAFFFEIDDNITLESVSIPDSVTSIGFSAFYGCYNLLSVTIPDSVTSIGNYAFDGCYSLLSVTIPDSVTIIGVGTFEDCSSLTNVTIPDGVTEIGSNAFRNCSSLTSVTIPESVTAIEGYAFYNCSSLTNVTVPDSVTTIDGGTFRGCSSLTSVTLSNSINKISSYTFCACSSLTSIVIPDGVTEIGGSAFCDCTSLTSVTVPDSVTMIGGGAFGNCSSLTSITLPYGLTCINNSTFYSCSNLVSIVIPDSVTSIGSTAFSFCSNLASVSLGKQIANIGEQAFFSCDKLKSIEFPRSLTSIGYDAFSNCYSLSEIWFRGSAPNGSSFFCGVTATLYYPMDDNSWIYGIKNYGGDLTWEAYFVPTVVASGECGENLSWELDSAGTLTISGTSDMWDYEGGDTPWYANKDSIKTVVIAAGVTTVGNNTFFNCVNLEAVSILGVITHIGDRAFAGCTSLKAIDLPEGITDIGGQAFECTSLESIAIPEGVVNIWCSAFGQCSSLKTVTLPDSLLFLGDSAFLGCTSLSSINIPRGLSAIESNTFQNCTGLNSITLPEQLIIIGNFAFFGCNHLQTISFDSNVEEIGIQAFKNCEYLREIVIPDSVVSLGEQAFYNCKGLKNVVIGDGLTEVGDQAFHGCINIETLTLGNSILKIGSEAFDGCNSLTTIEIPASVTELGSCCFWGCDLSEIYFDGSAPAFGGRCFYMSTATAYYPSHDPSWTSDVRQNYGGTLTWKANAGQCGDNLIWKFIRDGTLTISGAGDMWDFALNGSPWYDLHDRITSLVVDNGVTSIGDNAFSKCANLPAVVLPDGITRIGERAFEECTNLVEVSIPDSVVSIETYAFLSCNISSVVLPQSVTLIGYTAFSGCSSLAEIRFLGAAPVILDDCFFDVTATVYYPADDPTWIDDVMQNYGGTLTWVSYNTTPTIIVQPENVSVEAGESVFFTVEARGGDLSYQWQYRMSEAGEWTDCTENTANTASLSVTVDLSMNGYQYRCVVSNDAGSVISGTAVLIVNSKPVITSQPESFFTTEGYIATFTVEAEGLDLSYQWQYRESSSETWKNSNASGANTPTITLEATAEKNGFQFRCKVTNASGSVYSNVATLTVQTAPAITIQPTSKTAAPGTTVKFTVAATGATSYQWQYRKGSTGTWYNSGSTGNKTATLTVEATEARNGFQFRCKVTNEVGTADSDVATLTVVTKPAITTQPTSRTAAAGTTVTFSVAASGRELSYQWQYRKSSSGTWYSSSSTGNKTATLTMEATEARDGFQFRCKISNAAGTTYTQAVTLTVLSKPSITTQPTSRTVNEGTTASFKVVATNADSYQWQYRTSSAGSWYNSSASSATTATLTLEATKARNGFQFRCKISNSTGTVYSNAVTLTVNLKPSITTQPKNKTVDEGITATFKVVATGATSYQWQYRKSSSDSWYNSTADGAKTATLNVEATAARDGFQFRCKVSNAAGSVYSSVATLTVVLAPTIISQPKGKTVTEGVIATFKVVAAGAESYQWQYRKSSSGSWANSTSDGAKTAMLSIEATAARDGFQFRCKISNAAGSIYSAVVTLTVHSKPTIITQPTSIAVIEGTTAKFKVVATGAESYQWQYRTSSSGTWKDSTSSSAGTATLSIKGTTARNGFQFRCIVSNPYGVVYSRTVTLTVEENLTTYRALLIGQTYKTVPTASTLTCDKDVARMEELLNGVQGAVGGAIQVTSRIDVSYIGFQSAINSAFAGADSNDVSIFYYSGHGLNSDYESRLGALCTVEYNGSMNFLTFSELAQMLNGVPGKVVVILDSCHSGAAIYQNGNVTIVPSSTDLQQFCDNAVQAFAEIDEGLPAGDGEIMPNMGELRTSKFYVLTACAYDNFSYEMPDVGGGVFTFALISGIRNTMNADTNGDGKASVHELYLWSDYVVVYLLQEGIIRKYQAVQEYPQNSSFNIFAKVG